MPPEPMPQVPSVGDSMAAKPRPRIAMPPPPSPPAMLPHAIAATSSPPPHAVPAILSHPACDPPIRDSAAQSAAPVACHDADPTPNGATSTAQKPRTRKPRQSKSTIATTPASTTCDPTPAPTRTTPASPPSRPPPPPSPSNATSADETPLAAHAAFRESELSVTEMMTP